MSTSEGARSSESCALCDELVKLDLGRRPGRGLLRRRSAER